MDDLAKLLPAAAAEEGRSPRDLRLAFEGESFEWVERNVSKKSSKRKSAQK